MDVRKVVIAIVVIFVLFWIISAPTAAANFVTEVLHLLESAAQSIVTFVRRLV